MKRFAAPEDFRVDEIPLYTPAGQGDHTFVRVEKRLRTTEDVARDLARAAGVRPAEVGYAGRKDRFAVTTQWYSVPRLDPEAATHLELRDARVLEAVRHGHKLRTGHLRGNRFRVRIDAADDRTADDRTADVSERLARLVERGMPNRFGEQRFGREGDNVERGLALLTGRERIRDRRAARFLISALQARVFNDVLASRETPIHRLEAGDVAMLHESGGCFLVEDLAREAPRAASFEISATGPIFGTRLLQPRGAPAEREARIFAEHGVDPARLAPPRGIAVKGARRPLRVRPEDARVDASGDGLVACFILPPGSYATVLIDELLATDP